MTTEICVSPQCQAHLKNMGFNDHGFRSGGMFLHINMQDACVFCDWNDYHQRSHIVGWGFTQILSKAPTRKAKSPTFFFPVKIIGFDDHLCRLWKCWNHGFSCKLLVATLWRPSGLLKEPCILCFFAANCQLCLVEGHFTYVLFLRMSLISDIIIINLH